MRESTNEKFYLDTDSWNSAVEILLLSGEQRWFQASKRGN